MGCLNEHLETHGILKIPQKILAMESKLEAINTHLLAQASGLEEVATKNEYRHNQARSWTSDRANFKSNLKQTLVMTDQREEKKGGKECEKNK